MSAKWVILTLAGLWLAPTLPAAVTCSQLRVKDYVELRGGEFTLADLLSSGTCSRMHEMASRVNLGAAPTAGTVRVLGRSQVQGWLDALAAASGISDEIASPVPAKIVVQRAGARKSCAAIADFARQSLTQADGRDVPLENFNCAAAQSIPEGTRLALTKSAWNTGLQRWEFSLRCSQSEDCVPFLVWARAVSGSRASKPGRTLLPFPSLRKSFETHGGGNERLIKTGQTATLCWDERGIRIVLPVTCLDSGTLGQTVRVEFKNARRILRAEIMSDGTLRATGL
jgi:hypothetical protein